MNNNIKITFGRLIDTYGDGKSLFTFDICADYGVELSGSTIDRISKDGESLRFYYNENTGDYDYIEEFPESDLVKFADGLERCLQATARYEAKEHKYQVTLTESQLELIATICHDYKDGYRGEELFVRPVMGLEADLVRQTDGAYYPDTTYDITEEDNR